MCGQYEIFNDTLKRCDLCGSGLISSKYKDPNTFQQDTCEAFSICPQNSWKSTDTYITLKSTVVPTVIGTEAWYIEFTNNGSEYVEYAVNVIEDTVVDFLVVAGGGSGGNWPSSDKAIGGGGAGGLIQQSNVTMRVGTYIVKVGRGGQQSNGFDSSIVGGSMNFVAIGGGMGGSGTVQGSAGGSGGGGGGYNVYLGANQYLYTYGGAGTAGQGHSGSKGRGYVGGGGGGAGGSGGGNGAAFNENIPGTCVYSSITGSSLPYAAGGNGGQEPEGSNIYSACGIGGKGGMHPSPDGKDGAANTGSGGGGAGRRFAVAGNGAVYGVYDQPSGNGGSGVVIIRAKARQKCDPCPPSKPYSLAGSVNQCSCQRCPLGYIDVGDTCIVDCPAGSMRPYTQSYFNFECAARPGFYKSGNDFLQCPVSTYKATVANIPCSDCPSGSYVDFTGATVCSICGIAKYTDQTGQSVCKSCPQFFTTLDVGNQAFDKCICNSTFVRKNYTTCSCDLGYSFDSISTGCQQCVIGKYKESISLDACRSCPHFFTTALTASISYDNCTCIATFVRQNYTTCSCDRGKFWNGVTTCSSCAIGTYKDAIGLQSCASCPQFFTTATTGSTSYDACVCKPTFTRLSTTQCSCSAGFTYNAITQQCQACPYNTYKNSTIYDAACVLCPNDRVTLQTGTSNLSQCVCPSNYVLIGEFCVCPPGYEEYGSIQSSGICVECAKNYYKDTYSLVPCARCQNYKSTSTTGSISPENCTQLCPAGFINLDGTCIICNQSFTPQNCPANKSYTEMGSKSIENCKYVACPPGMTGFGMGNCTNCGTGFYKDTWGNLSCTECPVRFTTLGSGSNTIQACICKFGLVLVGNDCVCSSGYTLKDQLCQPCTEGTYKNTTGNHNCTACSQPRNYSVAGSTSMLNCTCTLDKVWVYDECWACQSLRPYACPLPTISSPIGSYSVNQCT